MLDEIKEGLSHFLERLKSPFGGVFIFIWTVTHWEFLYYLIFVSSEVPVEERIINLKFFFQGDVKERLWIDILKPALLTYIALITYYSFSIGAGIITGYFKRHWEPRIAKKLGTGATVMKSELILESTKRYKIENELLLCEQNRTAEFNRYVENETRLNSSMNTIAQQLSNLEIYKVEIENKLKSALNGNAHIIEMYYSERIKELKLMDYQEISSSFLTERMKDKKFNFHFDEKLKMFVLESFSIEDQYFYLVNGVRKFEISNVMVNTKKGEIYFEKRDLNGKLVYVNLILCESPNAQTFYGFEINHGTQIRYKILYSNLHLSNFQNYLSGT